MTVTIGQILLTRDQFREGVFERDNNLCVMCKAPAVDAHHILERRLWPDGGYYLDNGASVCGPCHMKAEQTLISCEDLRVGARIQRTALPPHLYRDQRYDKWGNPILDNGMRLRGELFDDESVQKVLAGVLHEFTNRVKYPRTYHLPWSPGMTDDDRQAEDLWGMFGNKEVVVTLKMDGENTTMYRDYIHARSLEYAPHDSRDRVKAMWATIAHDIPDGWRVCGENLYAEHSIHYRNLPAYFMVFSVWNEKNMCLPWDETKEWAELLGFPSVPEISRFTWTANNAATLLERGMTGARALADHAYQAEAEGYVVRTYHDFHYKDFRRNVAKYVRANHVQHKDGHWTNRRVVPNELRKP